MMLASESLEIYSNLAGVVYTVLWSLSFYPQIILNYKRKSVAGISLDFVFLNSFGFLCYSIYNLSFYYHQPSRSKYSALYGHLPSIHLNDVLFSLHAFILTFIVLIQCRLYRSRSSPLSISLATKLAFLLATVTFLVMSILSFLDLTEFFNALYFLSFVKIAVTLLKYIPQVLIHHTTKSTIGWSIENILLDLGGGIFSILQMTLDVIAEGSFSPITGNPVKLGLGLASLMFDMVFIAQHYFMGYKTVDDGEEVKVEEQSPLLGSRSSSLSEIV